MADVDYGKALASYLRAQAPSAGEVLAGFCHAYLMHVEDWAVFDSTGRKWLSALNRSAQERPRQLELPFAEGREGEK